MTTAIFDRAIQLRDAGLLEDALREFELLVAARNDPRDKYCAMLGEVNCLMLMQRFEQARLRLDQALTLLPDEPHVLVEVQYHRISLLIERQEYKAAYRQLESLLKDKANLLSEPDLRHIYEGIQMRRGYLLTTLQRPQEAIPILQETLSFKLEKSELAGLKLSLGSCYYQLGRQEEAKHSFTDILELSLKNKTELEARYHLAVIYFNSGAFAKAKQELEICEPVMSEMDIPRKDFYVLLAMVSEKLGQKNEVERYKKLAKNR